MRPFQFKQFAIAQDKCAMKVGTDGVLLGAWARVETAQRILDIGTGTGLIALMAAQRNSTAVIDAVEINDSAYQQASENFQNSPFNSRLNAYYTSIQTFQPSTLYDLIISNPPFFKKNTGSNTSNIARQIARQTDTLPHLILIQHTNRLLSDEGQFCVILPYHEGMEFIELAAMNNLYCIEKTTVKGRAEKPIERLLLTFSKVQQPPIEHQLVIQKSKKRHDYTSDYIKLTKAFYTIL